MFKFLFSALFTVISSTVQDCSLSTSLFKIETLTFTPTSPTIGENTTLYLKFNNPNLVVTDGFVTTSITYNFIPFNPSVEPLCSNTKCPIVSGFTEQYSSSPWPDLSGSVTIRIVWTDLDGNQLLCMQIKEKTMISDYLEGF